MLDIGISEIHRYPLRPEGFEEPLFLTDASKRVVADHLLQASWLRRASEIEGTTGESAHAFKEPVELERTHPERAVIVRLRSDRRLTWRKKQILRLLEHWREVKKWWDEDDCTDRMVFRVLIAGGTIAELARERSGEWFLTGVMD